MSNFEDRLWNVLEEHATHMTGPRRRPRRRAVRLVGAAAGVTAVATAGVTLFGDTATPAYAVTKGADGTVTTKINELHDAAGLEAALAKENLKAIVDFLPEGQTCREPRGERGELDGKLATSIDKDNQVGFDVEAGQIPPNLTLVLVISGDTDPGSAKTANLQVIKGEVAPCEPVSAPAPAEGGSGGDDNGPTLKSGRD